MRQYSGADWLVLLVCGFFNIFLALRISVLPPAMFKKLKCLTVWTPLVVKQSALLPCNKHFNNNKK